MADWTQETDADGTWQVRGNERHLITPSQAWLNRLPPVVPDVELEEIRAILKKPDAQINPAEQFKAMITSLRRLEKKGML
jgi:hypothetical protein